MRRGAKERLRRLRLAGTAAQPLNQVAEPHVGLLADQELKGFDRFLAALAAVDLQEACWPVGNLMVDVKRRRVHGRNLCGK